MAASHRRLGLPSWPDPHPGRTEPAEDEYSRVTDPERYRVVHARAHAWTDHLGTLDAVDVDTLAPVPGAREGRPGSFDRGVRLSSRRPGTLSLLLLERDVPHPVLHIGVVRPEVVLEVLPDCGCDACDSGSEDLLGAIDDTISRVVGGPFVVLQGRGWHARWHPGGGSSSGQRRRPGHREAMEWCRRLAAGQETRLPAGTEVMVGRSWLD